VRVLIIQRSLSPPGGGNAVAAWMVHALAASHQVDTLTASPWTAAATNAFYGTAIPDSGIRHHLVPRPWSLLDRLPDDRATRLRMCAVLRFARSLAADYDLLITADNYGAFARPGMQYLHFPAALNPEPQRWRAVVRLYFACCDWVLGLPWRDASHNDTLANSAWTATGLRRLHGVDARVLYPPVVDPGAGLPWEDRHNTFLCVGRFHGSKRIEVAMSIVRRLRARAMPDARLMIVGAPVDADYTARIHRFAARDRHWIDFRQNLSRAELNRLIGECRYGLHAMEDEHFGMATAELARGGCLVFAHRSGGSPEVVGGEDALLWQTEDEAARAIGAIRRDPMQAAAISRRLRRHADGFSPDMFVERFRQIVDEWAARRAVIT
jgi:glycosyltransferase involved in cell wall biosynthesis